MRPGRSRPGRAVAAGLAAVAAALLLASPAHAVNPVLDPRDDADVAAALAGAAEVQGVCYGYLLQVTDADTGEWGGTYAASSAGPDVPASTASGCDDVVELVARIDYTSSFSEAEDSASWDLVSTLPSLSIGDVEGLGLSAGDLLDDDRSATTLLHAVQALPRLASEQAGLPPVVLQPNTEPLPADAEPTGSPGSDWLRENGALLVLCVVAVLAGLVLLRGSRPRRRTGPPRFTTFGPPPRTTPSGRTPGHDGPGHDPWRHP